MNFKGKNKYDNIFFGAILGIFMPMVLFATFYLITSKNDAFYYYLSHLQNFSILLKVISLFVFINLLLFFIFIKKNYLLSARGILLATFVYALIVMIYKITDSF